MSTSTFPLLRSVCGSVALMATVLTVTACTPAESPVEPKLSGDQQAALAAANRLIATLSSKDMVTHADATLPMGRGTGTEIQPDGRHIFFSYPWPELTQTLPTDIPDGAVETLVDPIVRVDGDIAMVWADYIFTVNGELTHCGTDHFDLVRKDGVWRVLHLTWTTRRNDCEALAARAGVAITASE